jgi:V/A-type H+-transporting ATPase subunit B
MKEYKTINQIAGPLLFVEKTEPVGYSELVNIVLHDGTVKRGQVLDTSDEIVVVQVFETTAGIGRDSGVRFTGETIKMPVGREMLGRILSGGGKPIDGGPEIVPEKRLDITGAEAAHFQWCGSSPQRYCAADRTSVESARCERDICGSLCGHGYYQGRGQPLYG